MDFKQLQSFAAVVRCQSFTKAAELLYISQPTISSHIRALEEELGARLVIRTTKEVEITPRGWELYHCADKIFMLRDGLVESWKLEDKNVINLGTSTIPSAYILPEILPGFMGQYPGTQFHIHQGDSREVIEGVLDDSIKLGMVGMKTEDERLEFIPFYRDEMVLITPVAPHFLELKEKGELNLEDFIREPFLLREDGSGSRKCIARYFEEQGITEADLKVAARLNDQEAVKRLVACGLGVSIISGKAAQNFCQEEKLLAFPLPRKGAARSLYLVHRREFIMGEYIERFSEYVVEFYKKQRENPAKKTAGIS